MLTTLLHADVTSLFATNELSKNPKKVMIIVNIYKENFFQSIFQGTWRTLMKFLGKMCLKIMSI